MTVEAKYLQPGQSLDWTPTAALSAGEVIQVNDGRAAFTPTDIAAGVQGAVQVEGIVEVAKTDSMVMLRGSKVYWDYTANKAHLLQVNDKDFFLGTVQETAGSSATTVKVALNREPNYTLSLAHGFASVPVVTAGINHQIIGHGHGVSLVLDTTIEAQKMDALSIRGVDVDTPGLLSALVCVNTNGDDAAFDFNVGLASGTHASDADQIAESLFAHINGADTKIYLESDDNDSGEVAATDSTKTFTAGTPFLVQWDLTDNSDIQVYINGVNVLGGSTFTLAAASGPLKLLAHAEKSSNDSPGNVTVQELTFVAANE